MVKVMGLSSVKKILKKGEKKHYSIVFQLQNCLQSNVVWQYDISHSIV